jgi:hypothetical protein
VDARLTASTPCNANDHGSVIVYCQPSYLHHG